MASDGRMVNDKIGNAGGMAERTKATVLKTVVAERSPRVRIPLPPPQKRHRCNARGGARVVDWGRLLSGCGVNSSTQGSNPCLPASYLYVRTV
jgi:hypothetical protein